MRKLIVTGSVFFVGLAAAPSAVAQGAPCAKLNGDTNGDGTVDISDAVRLLGSLFLGDADPAALCSTDEALVKCQADLAESRKELVECRMGICRLPATGVTECADVNGALQVPCPDGEARRYPGQDGFYQFGCKDGRFVVNDNGTADDTSDDTVTDTCTGLEWQRNRAKPSQTYDPEGDGYLTWEEALAYCSALGPDPSKGDDPNADLAFKTTTHGDWRLPNVRELQSIINYGQRTPALDPVFQIDTSTDYNIEYYWTSSSFTGVNSPSDRAYAFTVNLEYGAILSHAKASAWHALAVRSLP